MNEYFYHRLIRKYKLILGNIFKNFVVQRDNSYYLVPLSFGQKEKFIQKYLRREESMKGVAMTLPRLAIEIQNINYDPERKLNRLNKIIISEENSVREIVYTPVPYNIEVKVSSITNRTDDSCEIAEQLIPIFTSDLKISAINLLENSDQIFDLSLNLNSIDISDNYQGQLEKRRLITWEFNFILKAYFFKNIEEENLIEEVIANFFLEDEKNTIINTVVVTE